MQVQGAFSLHSPTLLPSHWIKHPPVGYFNARVLVELKELVSSHGSHSSQMYGTVNRRKYQRARIRSYDVKGERDERIIKLVVYGLHRRGVEHHVTTERHNP